MKSCPIWTAALAAALLSTVRAEEKKPDEAEMKKFAGKWQNTAYVINGKEVPADEVKKFTWEIAAGGKMTLLKDGKAVGNGSLTGADAGTKPPVLKGELTIEGKKPHAFHGIYRFDGDKLELCVASADKPLPKEFASKADSGHNLEKWERVKLKKK